MSFLECVQKSAELSQKQKDTIEKQTQALYDKYKNKGGSHDAAMRAANSFAIGEAERIAKKKANITLQGQAIKRVYKEATENFEKSKVKYKNLETSKLVKVLDKTGMGFLIQKPSLNREVGNILERVYFQQEAFSRRYKADILDFAMLNGTHANVIGVGGKIADPDFVEKVILSAGGTPSGVAHIDAMGANLRKSLDLWADDFRSAGGVMGKIENWLPQFHDADALKLAGFDEWWSFIKARINWDTMVDDAGMPIASTAEVEKMTELQGDFKDYILDVYDTLANGSAKEMGEAALDGKSHIPSRSGIAGKRKFERGLHFKNANLQMEYNKQFGVKKEGLYEMILNHAHAMGSDVAMLRELGPSSDAVYNNLQMLSKGMGETRSPVNDGMYAVLSGKTASDGSTGSAYKVMLGVQNVQRFAQLGATPVAALGDAYWAAAATKMRGLGFGDTMSEYLGGIAMMGKNGQKELDSLGYIVDITNGQLLKRMYDDGTYISQAKGGAADKFLKGSQVAADFTFRTNGLMHLTQHGKDSVTLVANSKFAIYRNTDFDKLHPDFRDSMEVEGITAADWDKIRKGEIVTVNGKEFLFPDNVKDRDASMKFEGYIQRLRAAATNEPGIRTKALTTGAFLAPSHARHGDPVRAVMSNLSMYKSFPITVMNNFIRPAFTAAANDPSALSGAMMLAQIGLLTTISGGMVLAAKDALRNQKRDWDTPEFWQAAALQGGGMGLMGDFLMMDTDRYGNNMAVALAGPMIGLTDDMVDVVKGDGLDAAWALATERGTANDEELDKFLSNIMQFGERHIAPSSLWYYRAGNSYLFHDALGKAVDPLYEERQARAIRRFEKAGFEKIVE